MVWLAVSAEAAYNQTSMEAQAVTFALTDSSAGYEASPDRVRLGPLADFSRDVEIMLRGASREVDTGALDVAVVPGSVAITTTPIAVAPQLFRDLQGLLISERLDGLDAKRREVLERWQKTARQVSGVAFRISAPFLSRPIVVSAETDFHADDADQWVQVERYIHGEVLDLGGATRANAHVRLPDGSTLKVTTERDVLRDDTVNRLYKPAMLRIRAQYNVLTRELRDARLLAFVEYAPQFDDADMARLTRRGAEAWKGVPDATAWVDDLRGGGD
jgi:hypothetical protein